MKPLKRSYVFGLLLVAVGVAGIGGASIAAQDDCPSVRLQRTQTLSLLSDRELSMVVGQMPNDLYCRDDGACSALKGCTPWYGVKSYTGFYNHNYSCQSGIGQRYCATKECQDCASYIIYRSGWCTGTVESTGWDGAVQHCVASNMPGTVPVCP